MAGWVGNLKESVQLSRVGHIGGGRAGNKTAEASVNCNKKGSDTWRPACKPEFYVQIDNPDVLRIYDSEDLVCLLRSRLGHPPWFADLLYSMYFVTYACVIGSEQMQPCERFRYQPPRTVHAP